MTEMTTISGQNIKRSGYSGYDCTRVLDYDHELAETGVATKAGELLRRYWHPVALTSEVGELPTEIRVLGEDLILFRTTAGEIGLVHRHCPHRRASLAYGRCEENGIRCCYHGWLFAPDGEILETPGEAPGPGPAADLRARVRLGAYPVVEYAGLIFAYLGPTDRMPDFPHYDSFETPDITRRPYRADYHCNWIQVLDAIMDPVHTSFLHSLNSGVQFSEAMKAIGELRVFERGLQFLGSTTRRIGDLVWIRVNELVLPNFTQAGSAFTADGTRAHYFGRSSFTRWVVPVDDHNTMVLAWANFGERGDPHDYNSQEGCELIEQGEIIDRSYEERQRRPGDAEAVEGMGPISAHQGENLMPTDRGVSLYRRKIRKLIRKLAQGEEPAQPWQASDRAIRTYGQDTILYLPKNGGDDRKYLKKVTEVVMEMQFATEDKPLDIRDTYIIAKLKQFEKEGLT
ncbi:MAG: aromatic ring-hydroxylating dioxygenase subunit alpha [Gammaproteobacteria bacterium]|nr:aromatic ring-hydroxylating dioxygenase subunit alpha [Gammaproteobacteria bacterium]